LIIALADSDPNTQSALVAALDGVGYQLAWAVRSGAEAIRRIEQEPVDVLLLSARIADMTPADATRKLLGKAECAIILLAETSGLELSSVYDAMGAGAQDVVSAPRLDTRGRVSGHEALLAKLRTAGRLRGSSDKIPVASARSNAAPVPLVAIGASTGGPQALFSILSALPRPFEAAILIVQHVDSEFSSGLASWLESGSGMRVKLAQNGNVPELGAALLATSSDHLVMMAGGTLRYRPEPRELLHRPSVDVLFASLAEHWPRPAMAALLTGMGRDGAEGMKKLRTAGWHTVAQDQATSVVYGMPKAAVQLGAVSKILPLPLIAGEIAQYVARPRT
jgi:two-component system response regulator WspF